jgi:hypothetical protein
MADNAERKFGPHPTADFAACRVAEEVGELVQATTAVSKDRGVNRRERIFAEAVDVIAMVLRLVREFPDGAPATIAERKAPEGTSLLEKAVAPLVSAEQDPGRPSHTPKPDRAAHPTFDNVVESWEGLPPYLQPPISAIDLGETKKAEPKRVVVREPTEERCGVTLEHDTDEPAKPSVTSFETARAIAEKSVAEEFARAVAFKMRIEGCNVHRVWINGEEVDLGRSSNPNVKKFGLAETASAPITAEAAKEFIEQKPERAALPIGKPIFDYGEEPAIAVAVQYCPFCHAYFRLPGVVEFSSITHALRSTNMLSHVRASLTCAVCSASFNCDLPIYPES